MTKNTYPEWSEIEDTIYDLLEEKCRLELTPGQYWFQISPDPDSEITIGATFSGDNSWIPDDPHIRIAKADIRQHGLIGAFEYHEDPAGEYRNEEGRPVSLDGLQDDWIPRYMRDLEEEYDQAVADQA